jgi:Raf kinase inhibitor-like YbhB/YbcL family protein
MKTLCSTFEVFLCALLLIACSGHPQPAAEKAPPAHQPGFKIVSAAFKDGQPIPPSYTCKGVNVSPPLEWSGMPANAKTVAIVCDDPDAPGGTWVHWVLYNLPADNIGIVENMPATEKLVAGGFQGTNDFQKIGYGGPCPPSGTHRYFFKIYAVDVELTLNAGATKFELEKAMEGHVVGQAQLMGTFGR